MSPDRATQVKLDDADWKILGVMQRDGRATYAKLAEAAGISTASAHDRVRKLEQRGVITGYQAVVNPRLVGCGVTAYIAVSERGGAAYTDARERLIALTGVEECHSVAGDESFLLKVRAEHARARAVGLAHPQHRAHRAHPYHRGALHCCRAQAEPFPEPDDHLGVPADPDAVAAGASTA